MNNIEKNALKIAELVGYKLTAETYTFEGRWYYECEIRESFSSYNGLMPIVFESRRTGGKYFISIGNDYIAVDSHINGWINEASFVYNRDSEPEFIESIQSAIIKYLELKKWALKLTG